MAYLFKKRYMNIIFPLCTYFRKVRHIVSIKNPVLDNHLLERYNSLDITNGKTEEGIIILDFFYLIHVSLLDCSESTYIMGLINYDLSPICAYLIPSCQKTTAK